MRILLVDDDQFLRDMYQTKFTEHGDEVKVVETGVAALQMIDEETFDVVVMDMIMPGMSGVELIRAIKTSDNGKDCKCIVLSNQSEESDIAAAKKAGSHGYLIKADLIPSKVVAKIHELVTNP